MATIGEKAMQAIEGTAAYLTMKVEKRHKKHAKEERKAKHGGNRDGKPKLECHCEKEKLKIEESKKSPFLESPIANRKVMRRNGVAEQSEAEPKLLKEALGAIMKYEVISGTLLEDLKII